ncbi:MAG: pilin [Actinobacteria bacterium]|nr:pilin [Actinomycetota bacterium]
MDVNSLIQTLSKENGIPTGSVITPLIENTYTLLISVGIIACLIFILIGGISWASSGGDKTKVEKARKTLTFAIIGLVVILFAIGIIQIVGSLFGIPGFQFFQKRSAGGPIPNQY